MSKIVDTLFSWFTPIAALGLVGAAVVMAPAGPPAATENDMILASVQVERYCSGTVIEDTDLSDGKQMTVLSAKHCLNGDQGVGSIVMVNVPQTMMNEYYNDRAIKMIVTKVSEESDLIEMQAIKKDEGLDIPSVPIHHGIPKIGDEVWSIGFPLGGPKAFNAGFLSYVVDMKDITHLDHCIWDSTTCLYQQVAVPVDGGNSGGGLFVKSSDGYRLMGVLTGKDTRSSQLAYFTPLDEVQTFLGV